jgi:serine/threonine protein kinase
MNPNPPPTHLLHREVFYEQASDGFSSDIWSLGVVLYTFLTGHPLYSSPWDPAFLALSSGVRAFVFVFVVLTFCRFRACSRMLAWLLQRS